MRRFVAPAAATFISSEIAIVRESIAAGTLKQDKLRGAIDRVEGEQKRCAHEAQVLLSRYRLDVDEFHLRIGQLSGRAEELISAVRAIKAELEALLAKILSEAKVIATSLTKATISKEMDDQRFDVLVVDEVSMAPMPSLYFAAGRATQKVIVVGDFRQLPPICQAESENKELAKKLAKRAAQAGIESVGVISPYKLHARLIKMILDDSGDAILRHLKVSTVHSFQGLEQELIIFDIAEGPMPRYGPSSLVDGVELTSQAAKLINVSITRPRAQVVIVANVDYLTSRLHPDAVLLRVLKELRVQGAVVDSQEVVDDYFCSGFERWATLLDPHDDQIDPSDSTLYTERNFYAAFFADLRKGTREIIIVSPFLTASRAQQFFALLRSKIDEGIQFRVFTRTLREQQGDMLRQSQIVFEELKRIGVQLVERRGLHEKFAFIDRQVTWEGSLNILSQSEGKSTEHMRRLPFAKTCEELIEMHKFGADTEVAPGERKPIATDRVCKNCGAQMIIKRGQYGFFVSCSNFPECRESVSIRRGDRIGTDVICPGKDNQTCGEDVSNAGQVRGLSSVLWSRLQSDTKPQDLSVQTRRETGVAGEAFEVQCMSDVRPTMLR